MRDFLRVCVSTVSKRFLLFVILNWFFFGVMVVGALFGQVGPLRNFELIAIEEVFYEEMANPAWMVGGIFLFNLFLSGFVMVTLSGFVFFVFPVGVLLFRAVLWGALLDGLSTSLFLAALPTLVLEGEAYVLAALAGVNLGLSWLKPKWMFEGESVSRLESVKRALEDVARIYVLVAVLLFVATVVETVTILSF